MTERAGRGRWAEAGPETVRPGVHRVPLPLPNDGLRAVNVYLLEEDGGIVMVDGGWALPASRRALEDAMAALGYDLGAITRILVTHIHRDHYTQAVALRRLLGARVLLGAGERPGLEMLQQIRTRAPVTSMDVLRRAGAHDLADRIGKALDGADFDERDWEAPDEWLGAGVLDLGGRALRVIPTPGHTKGHVVYLDEAAGLLFAGDHVLPHITPSIGFELGEPGLPLADYLRSLRLMTTYADARLLPAHGPVAGSTHARVAELLAHHDRRLAATRRTLRDGPVDGYAVARQLTWTRREIPFADLDDMNQMLAVCETVAHLDVLASRGQAVSDGVRWTDGA
ncbi:MBL fold metallo-hydrolase [Phytohabitans rumicis]|uniref:MBL fold metallo-hydrolase n=1 Tax=Phytohabitans rumicis TaxID=1076125 RepID=A0A6V8KMU2_9ACTN|nr:MBL fold metallo-hydrolase [Phytohabitans rumicis]GFJ86473.1 MBL fold metallo-hydrolase [Phytohabitans rumicis]